MKGNENLSSKYKILKILRNAGAPVSGETIAQQAGISRVSVWKAVQALQASGYGIVPAHKGYFLEHDLDDSLFPWEFGAQEEFHLHFPQTGSTMTEARKIAEAERNGNSPRGKAHVVTADRQTDGVGQSGRKWTTTRGSLAFTLVTQNRLPVAESRRILMAAQIAAAKVLRACTGRDFFVRWPNDLWSADGKVGGLLDELAATGGICEWINVGIGINLNARPKIAGADAVTTEAQSPARKLLLARFQDEFSAQEQCALTDSNALASAWNSLCSDKSRQVRLLSDGAAYIFRGITANGFAQLQGEDGAKKTLAPGTDSFAKTQPQR